MNNENNMINNGGQQPMNFNNFLNNGMNQTNGMYNQQPTNINQNMNQNLNNINNNIQSPIGNTSNIDINSINSQMANQNNMGMGNGIEPPKSITPTNLTIPEQSISNNEQIPQTNSGSSDSEIEIIKKSVSSARLISILAILIAIGSLASTVLPNILNKSVGANNQSNNTYTEPVTDNTTVNNTEDTNNEDISTTNDEYTSNAEVSDDVIDESDEDTIIDEYGNVIDDESSTNETKTTQN